MSLSFSNPVRCLFALIGVLALLAAGCSEPDKRKSLFDMNKKLEQENQTLQIELDRLQKENKSLRSRVNTLSGLDQHSDSATVPTIANVEISSKSGIIDRDRDGRKETLLLYLHTKDDSGDGIKSAVRLKVSLWNLANPQNRALIEQWELPPDKMNKKWTSGLLGSFYRLHFPVADFSEQIESDLTVKVELIDYLTGRHFEDQHTLKQ